jgi:hypothetical protein
MLMIGKTGDIFPDTLKMRILRHLKLIALLKFP